MKKLRTNFITFVMLLLVTCFFKTSLAEAASLPTKYNMDLEFDTNTKSLNGSEEVCIKNSSGVNLKDLVFHLYADSYNKKDTMPANVGVKDEKELKDEEKGDISIDKVLINNKEVKFTQDNQLLKIALDNNFKNNEEVKVYIQFKLKIPMGTSRLGYMNDVYSLTNWYPILSMYDSNENKWDTNSFNTIGESNYSDVSDYNVNLKLPKNFTIASTGKEKEVSSENDTKIMNMNATNVRDFVIIMSPNYKVLSKEIDGIKVNSYYICKEGEEDNSMAQKVLDYSVDAVKFFSQQFGKYPYDELDLMETYLSGGAMEYPQIIQMPKYAQKLKLPENAPDQMRDMDTSPFILEATVHEVGHQWWYVTVGNNEFKEPFLDEALTAFSTAYYFEKTEGEYSQNGIVRSLRSRFTDSNFEKFISTNKFPSINSSVDKFDKNGMGYSLVIYGKGALLFEDLRKRVGEAKFLDIMQTYFKEYKFKNASIEDFLNIVEQKSGKSLNDVIKQSLNSDNYTAETLKLSNDELKKIIDTDYKDRLTKLEQKNGLILSSLYLKVLNGENAIVVKPSVLDENEKKALDELLKLSAISHKNISIKEDKDLTDKDIQNNNIILIGNPWNNKIFNSLEHDLPILITKGALYSNGFSIQNENINGMYTIKNPRNKDKLMTVYFWNKDNSLYKNLDIITGYQFIISIDNKQLFNGKF